MLMSEKILIVKDLERTYPGKVPTRALRGVSFEVDRGEFIAIMGRSGSGKSTLLHQLSLIDTPTKGSINLEGREILALSEKEKTEYRLENLGYIFQEHALIIELSALENVYIPAMALGADPSAYRARATELLNIVGLGDHINYYPNELSGGHQQLVAVARSLINKPAILFADEPTANLDTMSAEVVLDLFKKLQKEMNQTIVMVTHEPDDKRYVGRVIRMEDGLIKDIEE